MENLHQYFDKFFKLKSKAQTATKYIYSSYHVPGEGEHKILDIIRKNNSTNKKIDVIYGLDADLFFLAMASQKQNIFLLREENQVAHGKQKLPIQDIINDVSEELRFISIDIVNECYKNMIFDMLNKKGLYDQTIVKNAELNDFVFLCYFLGNDFLPHIPSIDIHKSGMDIILDCYTDLVIQKFGNLIYFDDGIKIWYENDKRHRLDGPAYID